MKLRNACSLSLLLALILAVGGCSAGRTAPSDGGTDDGDGGQVECTLATDCDDGNVCTDDACTDGECVHTNNDFTCDDGQSCSENDICSGGVCSGTAVGCDDDNPCTNDSCQDDTGCVFIPNTAPCDDGDECTVGDRCADRSCQGGDALECDDGNECTDNGCDPDNGCVFTNNTDPCDDGQACSENDHCSNGVCVGESALDCDDQNPCTEDRCDDSLSCVYSFNLAPCDDSNICTENDACDIGVCRGAALNCDDGNPCTTEYCDVAVGCRYINNSDPCDDGQDCTVGDICSGGSCQAGGPRDCDDLNPCTDDGCVQGVGCTHANNAVACDDGNPCTDGDHCQGGECVPGASPFDCDDGDPCTDDACDPGTGCSHSYNTAPCNDGNACTMDDVCSNGVCAGVELDADGDTYVAQACGGDDCDDGRADINPGVFEGPAGDPKCSDGVDNNCNGDTDLLEPTCGACNNDPECDDENVCNGAETCVANNCVGGAPLNCDDSEVCTTDTCDQVAGCQYVNNALSCDDGDACTTGDVCSGGSCQPGAGSLNCDDGNVCTTDSCSPAAGCQYANNALPCDDGNDCTTGDFCAGGSCQPGAGGPDCDDDNPCTDDSCVDGVGCVNTANDANPCNDGDACTINDRCSGGSCVGNSITCDDANVCTDDSCDSGTGCVYINNSDPCDDGDACTVNDQCLAGNCTGVLRDQDTDGYGDGTGTCPGDDCDDTDPLINPGVPETCGDDIDNNCNDIIDEGCSGCGTVDPSATLQIDNDVPISSYGLSAGDEVFNIFIVESSAYNVIEVDVSFYDFSSGAGTAQGDFSIHVYADDAGLPGAELGAGGVETVDTVWDQFHTFTLASPVAFTQEQLIWVGLRSEQDQTTNAFLPLIDGGIGIPYLGGALYSLSEDTYYGVMGNWLIRVQGCGEGPWLTLDSHSESPVVVPAGGSTDSTVVLRNRGFGDSAVVSGVLSIDDPEMVITSDTAGFGAITQGGTGTGSPAFGISADATAFGIYPMEISTTDGPNNWWDVFGLYVQGSGCLTDNIILQTDNNVSDGYILPDASDEYGNYFVATTTTFALTSVEVSMFREAGAPVSRFRVKVYTYRAGYPDKPLYTGSWVNVTQTDAFMQTFDVSPALTFKKDDTFFVTIESQVDSPETDGDRFGIEVDDGDFINTDTWMNGYFWDASAGSWIFIYSSFFVRPHGCAATELVYESHTSNPDPIQKGASATLNVTIRNVGAEDAVGITGTLSSPSPDVTVTTATRTFGDVAAGATRTASGFGITVAAGASEFQYPLDLELTDGTTTWDTVVPVQLAGATRNLTVQNFSTTLVGNDILYHFEVVNTGNVDIISAFDVERYIDRASAPGVGDAGDWTDTPTFLGVGQSITYDPVRRNLPTGSYDAWVQVDTNDDIAEANEGDNVAGPEGEIIGAGESFELIDDPPRKWFPADMPVGFRFVSGNSQPGMTQADARDAGRTGFAQWDNVASANLSTTELSEAEAGSGGFSIDGFNTMTFDDPYGELPFGALAATWPYPSGQTMQTNGVTFNRLIDADIVFNNNISYVRNGDPSCSFDYDLDGVATHEIGHLFGLDHPDVATATMYYAIGPCDMSKVSLDQSDINGITFIYP